jgi:endonuclease/exonuclease/phosphatase family metal-dependent hydrolase
MNFRRFIAVFFAVFALVFSIFADDTNTFTVGSYNVENWLVMDRSESGGRRGPQRLLPKPDIEKEAVWAIIEKFQPDVLGVIEMGARAELQELADGLAERGLRYPYTEWIQGSDDTRHVCLISRFPIVARHPHTTDTYGAGGQVRRVLRGVLEVTVQVNESYTFTAFVAHLKSKRATRTGPSEAEIRLGEARVLRRHVANVLQKNPHANVIVMGDMNDFPGTETLRMILGSAPHQLIDLAPLDSKGTRNTHFWESRGTYSCLDHLLVSEGMHHEFVEGSARIADFDGWNTASDHRAIYAKFYDRDRDPHLRAKPTKTAPPAGGTTAPPKNRTQSSLDLYVIIGGAAVAIGVILMLMLRKRA